MNDMKLIMENFRKFSNTLDTHDKSKIIIETKNRKVDLDTLILEYKNKKISKNEYVNTLTESIEKDFQELELLYEVDVGGALKAVGKKAIDTTKSIGKAVGAAYDKITLKLTEIMLKAFSLMKASANTAVKLLLKAYNFISGKKISPKTKLILEKVLVLGLLAGITYIIFKPSNAQAAVSFTPYGSDEAITLTKDNAGDVVAVLKTLTAQGRTEISVEDANRLIDIISRKGVASVDDYEPLRSALNMALKNAQNQNNNLGGEGTVQSVLKKALELGADAVKAAKVSGGSATQGFSSVTDVSKFVGDDQSKLLELFKQVGLDPSKLNEPNMPQQFAGAVVKKFGIKPLGSMDMTLDRLGSIVRQIRGR